MTNENQIEIARDAVIEGRGAEAEIIASTVRASLDACVAALGAQLVANFVTTWPTNGTPKFRATKGRRFIKISFGGSTWGMVEISNGFVWATMCGKAVTNFPRGCVFDADSLANLGRKIHGIGGSPAYHAL